MVADDKLTHKIDVMLLCVCGFAYPACASPPAGRAPAEVGDHPAHLDLQPPSLSELAGLLPERSSSAGMPSAHKRTSLEENLPALRAIPAERPASHLQAMAQKFGREGLPLARLWENHSALLSSGLSPKGKPGLWLVQKIH
jgi:hypothetical protein